MKNLLFIIIFFLVIGCSNNKQVYWCGDHACVNKKEREEYFKKNMIVEVRNYDESKKMIVPVHENFSFSLLLLSI